MPSIFLAPDVESWWSAGQIAVMLAAAWVLYAWFASAALTAGAWVVAESYRGMPWLAANKR